MPITTKNIIYNFKRHGIFGLLRKTRSYIFSYVPLNYYCISHMPSECLQAKCQLYIRKGTIEDIPIIINLFSEDSAKLIAEQTQYLFNQGGDIFLAFSEDHLVHAARVRYYPGILKDHPHERCPLIRLKEDELYIGHCETNPAFRGKNIYPVMLQHIAKYAFEKGIARCFGSSSPQGKSSIIGIRKAGFNFVAQKRRFRIFGKIIGNGWSTSSMKMPVCNKA